MHVIIIKTTTTTIIIIIIIIIELTVIVAFSFERKCLWNVNIKIFVTYGSRHIIVTYRNGLRRSCSLLSEYVTLNKLLARTH